MSFIQAAKKLVPLSTRRRMMPLAKVVYRDDLNRLAPLYGTDKWGSHWYTPHYQRYLGPLRKQHLNLLEIGVGGEAMVDYGGASLRMWKRFFPNARIVGIDIFDKRHFSEPRIDVRICDQTDAQALRKLSEEYGGFDIIIDDGSHVNEHVIGTFRTLFPLLRPNGIYAIEDTQTSYWPSYGGGRAKPDTLLNFFKGLTDCLNYAEYSSDGYMPDSFERSIVEMAFFHNLVIVRKGINDERSNQPEVVRAEMEAAGRGI
ncbi:MAG TPA: class I SAM-dependent methyltransferase [Acidobacteriaceae bacterium]